VLAWGYHMAEVVNELKNLPEDLTVHIFSLRGDGGPTTEEKIGRCILYNISKCKIEELRAALSEYNIENKVDLAVSHWTFRHFADPLGSFKLTIDYFLRPKTGFLFMDGFFTATEKIGISGSASNANLLIALQETKAPFLIRHHDADRSLNQFVLKRPDDKPSQLRMSYIETIPLKGNWQVESGVVTRFRFNTPNLKAAYPQLCAMHQSMVKDQNSKKLYGDEELFSYFSENKLFEGPQTYGEAISALPDDSTGIPGAAEYFRSLYAKEDPDSKMPDAFTFGGSNK